MQTAQSKPNCSCDAAKITLHADFVEVHVIFREPVGGRLPNATFKTPELHVYRFPDWGEFRESQLLLTMQLVFTEDRWIPSGADEYDGSIH
jgi:hypothetical protein